MPDATTAPLVESLTQSLETMTFIMANASQERPLPPPALREVSIRFRSDTAGWIELAAPEAFARLLAANALGLAPDADLEPAVCEDALRELLNVTCGTLLQADGVSRNEPIHMSIPQVRSMQPEEWTLFIEDARTQVMDAEGYWIAIRFVEEGPSA